jgi:type IV pilus assembly protein PilM
MASSGPGRVSPAKAGSSGKKTTVGVEIGYTEIKLARIRNHGERKRELLDFKVVPIDPEIKRDSPRFTQALQMALSSWGLPSRGVEVWSNISAAQVEIRRLLIPKVPKKQLYNAVFWTYKKEAPFDERESVFDYEVLGELTESGLRKMEVLAYTAPKREVAALTALFERCGCPLAGVTIIPFALQNLFRSGWIPGQQDETCSIYVGRNWSRIDIFANGNLLLSRGIKAGLNSMVEAVRAANGVAEVDGFVMEPDPDHPVDDREARRMFEDFLKFDAGQAVTGEVRAQAGRVFEFIKPALDRLVRQVERTFEHFSANFGGRTVSRILISGRAASQPRIVEHISGQLNLPVELMDSFAGAPAGRRGATTSYPTQDGEMAPAVGLGLSAAGLTPNFLVGHKDRLDAAKVRSRKQLVFGLLAAAMLICGGFYYWQSLELRERNAEVARLQQDLSQYNPVVDQDLILQMAARIKKNRQQMENYKRRYLGMSVISELSRMTPDHIRLLDVTASLPEDPKAEEATAEAPAPAQAKKVEATAKTVKIEGLVQGEVAKLESLLTEYLLGLEGSPLFGKPGQTSKATVAYLGQDALKFTASLNLE